MARWKKSWKSKKSSGKKGRKSRKSWGAGTKKTWRKGAGKRRGGRKSSSSTGRRAGEGGLLWTDLGLDCGKGSTKNGQMTFRQFEQLHGCKIVSLVKKAMGKSCRKSAAGCAAIKKQTLALLKQGYNAYKRENAWCKTKKLMKGGCW